MVRFNDYVGEQTHKHSDLETFIRAWFKPEDEIVLGAFRAPNSTLAGGKSCEWAAFPVADLLANSSEIYEVNSSGQRDIYFRFTPVKSSKLVTASSPGKDNTGEPRGLWADLDVGKENAFDSQQQILDWLADLPAQPTAIVRNGVSGGIHAYWRILDADLHRLTKDSGHMQMWWAFLQEQTPLNQHGERIKIDRLTDIGTRLARLPGMTYWPKTAAAKHGAVSLAGGAFKQLPLAEIESIAGQAYSAYKANCEEFRAKNRRMSKSIDRAFASPLQRLILEERINSMHWGNILRPLGWTSRDTAHGGTRQWTRPGSTQKSATTDYERPDDGQISVVMSLHSSSEDTGLLDLKQSGEPLTKFRVLLRLYFNDDITKLLQEFKNKSSTSLGGFMLDRITNQNESYESRTT